MEAPRDAVIDEVAVSEGDQVVEGTVLVTFAETDATTSRFVGQASGGTGSPFGRYPSRHDSLRRIPRGCAGGSDPGI